MESSGSKLAIWNVRLYYISMALLLASIPLSKYTTSLFQFAVLAFWIFYQSDTSYLVDFKNTNKSLPVRILLAVSGFLKSVLFSILAKFKAFSKEKTALLITSLLLLHVIGLVYTQDFHYAFKDLRTKLPLFLLPLFFSTGPGVKTRTMYWILAGYIAAIIGGTFYRLYLFENLPVADPRAINSHISHIRFSLNAVFAIFILGYFIRLRSFFTNWQKILMFAIILWFIFILFYLRYTTGIAILVIISLFLLLYQSLKGSKLTTRLIFLLIGFAVAAIPVVYISSVVRQYWHTEPVDFHKLDKYTQNGNSYYHDTVNFRVENGKYVGLYICDKELRKAWAQRSSIAVDSLDRKQQIVRYTLIRYLASKNLRKDSAGIAQLNPQDILNIEAGLTNANSRNGFDLNSQIDNFLTGWDNYIHHNNPNSSSLIQRIEYWRTSLLIIQRHPLEGVGTGDVPEAFRNQYESMKSSLDPQYRLRSHNQFLSITVAFGLSGLIWFLIILIYPILTIRQSRTFFYMIFWLIFVISMFTEDTIETQEGVTFFAYFSALFLCAWKHPDDASTA